MVTLLHVCGNMQKTAGELCSQLIKYSLIYLLVAVVSRWPRWHRFVWLIQAFGSKTPRSETKMRKYKCTPIIKFSKSQMCRARRAGYKSLLMCGDVYDIAYKLTCWVVAEFPFHFFFHEGLKYCKKGKKQSETQVPEPSFLRLNWLGCSWGVCPQHMWRSNGSLMTGTTRSFQERELQLRTAAPSPGN